MEMCAESEIEKEGKGGSNREEEEGGISFHCISLLCSLTLQSMLMRKFPVMS